MDKAVEEFFLYKHISKNISTVVSAVELDRLKQELVFIKNDYSVSYKYCEKIIPILCSNLSSDKSSEHQKITILECLEHIFSVPIVKEWKYFGAVFITVVTCISSHNETDTYSVKDCSEELKEHVLRLLKTIINQSVLRHEKEIYQRSFAPSLGHAIFILLLIAKSEKSSRLKILAFDIIQAFFNLQANPELLADRFSSFLPGISLCCTHVIRDHIKQQKNVIVSALKTWQILVVNILADSLYEGESKDNNIKKGNSVREKEELISEVKRTKHWVEETASKLKVLVMEIVKLASHDNWRVRFFLLEWAEGILFTCFRSLNDSLNLILEVVVALQSDEYKEVSRKSMLVIQRFSGFYSSHVSHSLRDKLSEDLHSLATRLPRIMRSSDDTQKRVILSILSGYFQFLGPQVNHLLQSLPHRERLIMALLQVTEMDTTENHVLQQEASGAINLEQNFWPKKTFKHFQEAKILDSVLLVCKLLGFYGDVPILCDALLEKVRATSLHRKQAILILNHVFLGTKGIENLPNCSARSITTTGEIADLVKYAVDVYLSPTIWDVSTEFSHSKAYSDSVKPLSLIMVEDCEQDILTLENVKSNILQKCLLLEGFSAFAQILGDDFQGLLLDVLYPVLKEVGSTSTLINHTAKLTLQCISRSCTHSTVNDLITSNADYLVNSLSLKLCHYTDSQSAASVLDVVLQLCTSDILFLLQDSLNQVLFILDRNQDHNVQPFLKVLHTLLLCIQRWFIHYKVEDTIARVDEKSNDTKISAMKDFLTEYHRVQMLSFETDEDVDEEKWQHCKGSPAEEEAYLDSDINPDKKPELPLQVELTLKVLERCLHMQNSSDKCIKLLVLEIVEKGIQILAKHQDQLLPMVHKFWSPFIHRFSDIDRPVIIKALDVLLVMAECCGEFIHRRSRDEVWPKLSNFIKKQSKISAGKSDKSAYAQTFDYKLQLKTLMTIGQLAKKLEFQESHLESVCMSIFPYLEDVQPQSLQEATVSAFKCLIDLDPDLVWFVLRNASPKEFSQSCPASNFHPVHFGRLDSSHSFNQNVDRLLNILEM